MGLKRVAILCLALLVMAGCRNPYLVGQRFEESSREQNRMLRWQELEQSCQMFAAAGIRELCMARAKGAKGVSIADFRVTSTDLDTELGIATVRMEIDYYILPNPRLKTIEDVQKWHYVFEEGLGRWYLDTPPPEFR